MYKIFSTLPVVLALLVSTAGGARSDTKQSTPPATPEAAAASEHTSTQGVIVGKVTQMIDAGRYTYVEVDTGDKRVWAAGPQVELELGDSVYFPSGMPMTDFMSKSLGRKFDLLYMVDSIRLASSGATPTGTATAAASASAAGATAKIEQAMGGYTVAQIFEQRTDLAGREIAVRGRVVKFNRGIMGRNWVHVQDGTAGPGGANDLVVTTDALAEVGSIVLVRGTAVANKDFGSGYAFDVLIDEASLTAE